MLIKQVEKLKLRKEAELLVLPFLEAEKKAKKALWASFEPEFLDLAPIKNGDFFGQTDESFLIYPEKEDTLEKRLLLWGLGTEKKLTLESVRHSAAALVKKCRSLKVKKINLLFPSRIKNLKKKELFSALLDGLYLANYAFSQLKQETLEEVPPLLEEIALIGLSAKEADLIKKKALIAEGVYLARDLVMGNADDVTPQKLAEVAQSFQKLSSKIEVEVLDKKKLEKARLSLLLAVNRASALDPALIIIHYKGSKEKKLTALVGKGLTYDTGGLCLKPASSMDTMKCDMAGAAAVLGAIRTAALLNLKVNLVGVIPATENAIGSKSYKPGDVYPSHLGKTVEVENTDAEGRLILADALSYAIERFQPDHLIDLATLTGAISIALGEEIAGFFTNDAKLVKKFKTASKNTGEHLWHMPLFNEYLKNLNSEIADLKNTGDRKGGSIAGALFLNEFVSGRSWVHLDIGGSAYYSKPKGYYPVVATGYGVRLLIELFENGL
ncbi:MAG: leucyl aminopeptidase [Parachlamydiales bacterium]|jgi:leucyl aminopeptidase